MFWIKFWPESILNIFIANAKEKYFAFLFKSTIILFLYYFLQLKQFILSIVKYLFFFKTGYLIFFYNLNTFFLNYNNTYNF